MNNKLLLDRNKLLTALQNVTEVCEGNTTDTDLTEPLITATEGLEMALNILVDKCIKEIKTNRTNVA